MCIIAANTFPNQDKALRDDSHFNAFGAFELARIVADGIKATKTWIWRKFLSDDLATFDPSHPDNPADLALPNNAPQIAGKPEGN